MPAGRVTGESMVGRIHCARALVLACALALHAASQAQVQAPAAEAQPRIHVLQFEVTGNTLLSAASIDAALAGFRGERTLAELKQAAHALQALYAAAGYGAVVAYLPPQQPAAGVVTIAVIEGRLARVRIEGNHRYTDAEIRASLPALVEGRTPRLAELDAQIQLANENPGKQLRVLLQPGSAQGDVEARVSVSEQPLQRWTLGLDNTGNDRTGEARASVGWQHADLSGRDDVASLQWQTAPANPSRVNVLGAGYHLPLYAQRMTLDAYAAYSDVDSGRYATPVGSLQFNGRGRAAGLRVGRALAPVNEVAQRVFVGLDYRAYLNQCAISGLPDGACGPAGESVSVQPLVLEYLLQGGGSTRWSGSVALQHNLQVGGGLAGTTHFEAVRPGAEPRYSLLRLYGSLLRPLADALQLQLRAAGQWTSDALVPGEQFGVGGIASVRGYEERELAGDRGGFASAELSGPEWALPGSAGHWSALVFADAGWLSNRHDAPCMGFHQSCRIASAGAGVRAAAGRLQAQLYVATALVAGPQTERNSARAHASVAYGF